MTLLILYILSVLISGAVLWREYLQGKSVYKFTWKEKILGLVIVPLIPIVNLILAFIQYQSNSI
jgi:hypothetical protein